MALCSQDRVALCPSMGKKEKFAVSDGWLQSCCARFTAEAYEYWGWEPTHFSLNAGGLVFVHAK